MTYISSPLNNIVPRPKPNGQLKAPEAARYRTAGIIGGIAPQSTSLFYQTIVEYCLKRQLPAFPNLLINSINPWEVVDILKHKDMQSLFLLLEKEIRRIQDQADFLVMVCNSVHAVVDPLRKVLGVPIMAIYEEVCKEIDQTNIKKIGILGTKTTVDHCFYQKELLKFGITAAVLPPAMETAFDTFIFEEMLHGRGTGTMKNLILAGIEHLKDQGCEGIVLACTELPLFIDQEDVDIPLFSSTKILAQAVVQECFSMKK